MQTSDKLFAQNWIEQYRDNMANVRLMEAAQVRGHETASDVCAFREGDWDGAVRYTFIWAESPQGGRLWSDRCVREPYRGVALIR